MFFSVTGEGDWQSFSFATAFVDPPVVLVLATGGGDPQDVKIRGVTTDGFEALLVVPPPGTGNLPAITVSGQNAGDLEMAGVEDSKR